MASRTDRFIDGMFFGRVNPKDGYAVADYKDPRVKRVLEFLVPLLYPEKPMRVTITVGNTIFGALSGERPVDWGIVVKDLVQRLLSRMGKSKATPICPYMFHLYQSHELLLPAEKKEYRIQEALVKHNVESEEDDDPASPVNPNEEESSNDSECESLTPSEIQEIQKQDAARLKKSRINKKKNLQHQRIRSPANGRAQHQWMQWSETTRPLRSLAGRSGQESVNGRLWSKRCASSSETSDRMSLWRQSSTCLPRRGWKNWRPRFPSCKKRLRRPVRS